MAEANAAEPNEGAAPSPRRPRRKHAINLCCAQSVQVIVEEVARNLQGLGFAVTVVCGAEARAALLGSSTKNDQPTIHVVCVQGSLQERVLKPLRQALATHGGPNHHLFVAVLDLAVPLAMVGQIRRYAEALERPPPPRPSKPGAPVERRSWRENKRRELATTHSAKRVVERPGSKSPSSSDGEADRPRRRPRTLSTRGRAAKISGTSKYKKVTASHTVVPTSPSGVRKRKRTRSRLSAAASPTETSGGRVLGVPQPVTPTRSTPPPPPPPGEMARRRSSTTLPATSSSTPPPPPPPRRTRSSPSPSAPSPSLENAVTTHHRPWKGGKPPASGSGQGSPRKGASEASGPSGKPDADRLRPRAKGFRFTPPGVEAAEPPTKATPRTTVPVAEVLPEGDRSGVLEEVPRSSSGGGSEPEAVDRTVVYDTNNEPIERLEPTQVTAAPEDPAASESPKPSDEITAPAVRPRASVTGETVVVSSPDAGTDSERAESAVTVPRKRKTVLYLERAEDGDLSASIRPPGERKSVGDVDESAKTLLKGKGKGKGKGADEGGGMFPDAKTVLSRAEQSQSPTGGTVRTPVVLDPEDREDGGEAAASEPESEPKPKKTVLYGEKSGPKPDDFTDQGGTKVAAASTIAGESLRRSGGTPAPDPVDEDAATRDTAAIDEDAATRDTAAVDEGATAAVDEDAATRDTAAVDEDAATRDSTAIGDTAPAAVDEDAETRDTTAIDDAAAARGRTERSRAEPSRPTGRKAPYEPSPQTERSSRGWMLWVVLLLLIGGGGFAAYQAGLLDGLLGRDGGSSTTASRSKSPAGPTGPADPKGPADSKGPEAIPAADDASSPAEGGTTGLPAAASDGEPGTEGSTTGTEPSTSTTGTTTGAEPSTSTGAEPATSTTGTELTPGTTTGTEPEPVDTTTGTEPEPVDTTTGTEPEPADSPELTPDEQLLAKAADRREIVMLKTLFASRRQGSPTTWNGGAQRCGAFEVDGVKGWRLPHRREMKLLNAVLPLASGLYWTKTVPKDDRQAAYMLDTSNGSLALFLKQEPTGEVLCVRRRKKSK